MKSLAARRWIRSLIQSWFSQPARLTRKARIPYRLQVEALEDRVVPSSWLVTNTSNSANTSGSLPWAVGKANTDTSNADITFDPADFPIATTITLASTLTLTNTAHSITIDGSGAGPITVSGGKSVRDFTVNASVTATFNDLTISGGSVSGNGAGIDNTGTATVDNCTISGNKNFAQGAGIYNSGSLTVNNSTISDNSASAIGGGISNTGSATVSNSVLTGNTTGTDGGALGDVSPGTLTINNSTISDNSAFLGGALYIQTGATVSLANSALTANSADAVLTSGVLSVFACSFLSNLGDGEAGAAINNAGGTLTLLASTFSGNSVSGNAGGALFTTGKTTINDCTLVGNTATNLGGGAIGVESTTLMVVNSTITGNNGGSGPGGIYVYNSTVTLVDTIVAGNSSSGASVDVSGTLAGGNNNLIGNGTGMTGITNGTNGNLVGTSANPINPDLGTLSSNGGATQTIPLLSGSPAIGAGGAVTTVGTNGANNVTTTIPVANGSFFGASSLPTLSSGSYCTIQIDGEQMAVIGTSSSSLTVVRAINGTTAAMHSSGASVYLVSDQRGYLVPANTPPVVDMGAYQTTGANASPTVTAVNPEDGSQDGGTSVTITGTNFTGTTAVFFGSVAATSFTVNSNTQITAVDPAEAAGTVDIGVAGPLGPSAQSASDEFTYNIATTTSVTSNPVGPITQGTSVTFTASITGNPSVGTVLFYFDYGAADQFQIGSAVNVSSGSATSDVTTALPVGADTITAIYSGGVGFEGSQGTLVIQVSAPPPPSITSVVINQDLSALYNAAGQPSPGVQRSMVGDIVYTFSEAVNVLGPGTDPNVFTVAVAAGWSGTVPTLSWAPVASSGDTQWAVSFSGSSVTGGSIANGAYTITVTDPASITAESDSQALSLAGSGIGGATQSFYRLFGDINGDEIVNAADNARFKQALTTYNPAFDYNQDGFVNACDNCRFKLDLTVNFSGFTATI